MDHPHTPAPIERYAALVADAACDLSDAVAPGRPWTQAALEDTVDAVALLAQLLAEHDPAAARALTQMPGILGALRTSLGIEETDKTRSRTTHPPRRGLGPGFQGIAAPPQQRRRALGAGVPPART